MRPTCPFMELAHAERRQDRFSTGTNVGRRWPKVGMNGDDCISLFSWPLQKPTSKYTVTASLKNEKGFVTAALVVANRQPISGTGSLLWLLGHRSSTARCVERRTGRLFDAPQNSVAANHKEDIKIFPVQTISGTLFSLPPAYLTKRVNNLHKFVLKINRHLQLFKSSSMRRREQVKCVCIAMSRDILENAYS